MVYRIGICDDEQNIVLNIMGYVEHYFQLQGEDVEIHTWNSGEELIDDKAFEWKRVSDIKYGAEAGIQQTGASMKFYVNAFVM